MLLPPVTRQRPALNGRPGLVPGLQQAVGRIGELGDGLEF